MRSPLTHFLIALAVGAATLIGYGFWYTAVGAKSKGVADLQSQITTATANVSHIASARAALAEIAGDEAKVQSYFVLEADVVGFINDLEARGRAEKASVSVLSVSKGGSPVQSMLLLALTVTGTFDAVMRTLGAIEYAPYDLSISTLSIQQDAKDSWHADLNLTVGSVPMTLATSTP